jgi:hypothetical protein
MQFRSWIYTAVSVAGVALFLLACEATDPPGSEAINPRITLGADTLTPEVIESALVSRLGGTSRGGRVFCAYTPLGQEANRVAVWALCQEYVASGDSVETGTGSSAPALLVIDTLGIGAGGVGGVGGAGSVSTARVAEVRVPRDGNLWSQDIESIFSGDVVRRIHAPTAAHNRRADLLLAYNREAARAYFKRAAPGTAPTRSDP